MLGVEKKLPSKLMEPARSEKLVEVRIFLQSKIARSIDTVDAR